MTHFLKKIAVTTAFILGPTLTIASEAKTMSEDHKKVLETITSMGTAYNAGDIDAVMTAYDASAVVAFEPGKPIGGTETVKQMFQESLVIQPKFVFGEHDVIITDDVALHITPWEMTGQSPEGQQIKQSGLSVAVLRKQDNGDWLLLIDNPHGHGLLP